MKVLHILVGCVLFVLLVGAALLALSTAFHGPEAWNQWLDGFRERQLEAIFICLTVVFLVLLYALTSIRLPERVKYLAYDIEGGTVSISLKAIQDFLSKLSDEFAAVVSLHPTIKVVNGGIDVQLDVKIKSGAQIPELCRMLQEKARESLLDKVGFSDIKEIRVRVQEIVVTTSPNVAASETKPGSFD